MQSSVKGIVQAVGFRQFLKERADEYSLTGWARNVDDGSVKVASRGPNAGSARFGTQLLWVRPQPR